MKYAGSTLLLSRFSPRGSLRFIQHLEKNLRNKPLLCQEFPTISEQKTLKSSEQRETKEMECSDASYDDRRLHPARTM